MPPSKTSCSQFATPIWKIIHFPANLGRGVANKNLFTRFERYDRLYRGRFGSQRDRCSRCRCRDRCSVNKKFSQREHRRIGINSILRRPLYFIPIPSSVNKSFYDGLKHNDSWIGPPLDEISSIYLHRGLCELLYSARDRLSAESRERNRSGGISPTNMSR